MSVDHRCSSTSQRTANNTTDLTTVYDSYTVSSTLDATFRYQYRARLYMQATTEWVLISVLTQYVQCAQVQAGY